MSTETKKPNFLDEALTDLSRYLYEEGGLSKEQDRTFNKLMERYLKQSFRNGVETGYRKAKREKRAAVAQPRGSTSSDVGQFSKTASASRSGRFIFLR